MLKSGNVFFPIELAPIYVGDSEVKNRKAIVNVDSGAVLGIVSNNYVPILNRDVYDFFFNKLKEANTNVFKEIHHLDVDGRKWSCDLILGGPDTDIYIQKDDIIHTCVRIFNSYDGRHSFGYEVFGFRLLCENGQVLGRTKQSIYNSFRHLSIRTEEFLADFLVKLSYFKENAKIWEKWALTEYSNEQMIKFIEDSDVGVRLQKRILEALENEKIRTLWDGYNSLTFYLSHRIKTKRSKSSIFTSSYNNVSLLIEKFYKEYSQVRI